jgi:ABC-2 type transport system ATP-binding protein
VASFPKGGARPSSLDTSRAPIVVRDVSRAFGSVRAVDGITLDVRAGEMFGVIGPDGAGKTTLLRMICGLERADRGTVEVFGADPRRARRVATSAIGYLSQQFSLYGDLTIDENIAFFARLHGVHDFADRRDRLLELTGLIPFRARLADRLSGGMKQKLALSCTLVHEPPLVVLDEPTTGVDPVSRREFWKLLAEFVASGLTIVLATPYLDEAERCSRVALLADGRVLALEEPGRLRESLPGRTVEVVAADLRHLRDLLDQTAEVASAESFGDRLHVRLENGLGAERLADVLIAAGVTDARVRSIAPSLEDVFIELLARPSRVPAPDVRGNP